MIDFPLIQLRWYQTIDKESGEPSGMPVLQYRVKIRDGLDGKIDVFYEFQEWKTVPFEVGFE
jgi:hypothetical protein